MEVSKQQQPQFREFRSRVLRVLAAGAVLSAMSAIDAPVARAQMDEGMRSERMRSEVTPRSLMKDEVFGVKPQVGVVLFKPATNGVTTRDTTVEARGLVGVTTDLNIVKLAALDSRVPWYGGVSTGLLASHIGAKGADFFGTGAAGGGSNFMIVPMNLKVGYNVNDAFRVSLHGGGNATYRSITNNFNFSKSIAENTNTRANWTIFPNVGADFEFGQTVAILVRPDLTITPADNIFTGSVAVAIPLG